MNKPATNIFIIAIVSLAAMLSSCTQHIDIDYKSVEKQWVVEANLSDEGTLVRVSKTVDMNDTVRQLTPEQLQDVQVSVHDDGGASETLLFDEKDGMFHGTAIKAAEGRTYRVVFTEESEHSATSNVMAATELVNAKWQWIKMFNSKLLLFKFSVKDIPNESTFFRYRIYRNGELYKWSVFRDKGYENMNVVVNVVCMSEEQMKKDDPDDDDVLHEGDEIHLEVETINRRTYDFLHILKSMSNSGANPVSMFDGALGYLAVYVPVKYDCVFQKSDISGQ
ncbi:MAG: DUF4249 family protein [Paludibacteraceae bacterium]|nr:DUF4249 family protein [Paludibacteraceae bacterium]